MKGLWWAYLLLGVLGSVGCQPTGGKKPSDFPYFVQDDEIILHKSHIMAVKTSLYQPSFGLSGIILPKHQANITAPHDGTINMMIQTNQLIQKGDTLAVLTLPPSTIAQDTTPTADAAKQHDPNSLTGDPKATQTTNSSGALNHTLTTPNDGNDTPPYNNHPNQTDDAPTRTSSKAITANSHSNASQALTPTPIQSPMTGRILETYHADGADIHKGDSIALIGSADVFEFATTLPSSFERYLAIGQSVQFTHTPTQAPTTRLGELSEWHNTSFAGQITDIRPADKNIAVTVQIKSNDNSLHKGMQLVGQVDYGQLAVGVVVPHHAIADGANLKELSRPPYKPLRPIAAKVWVIEQDGRLHLTDVTVVEYDPTTKNYLIVGVNQTSLIVTANLPLSAHNLPVVIR